MKTISPQGRKLWDTNELQWRTILFPGRMFAMELVIHVGFGDADSIRRLRGWVMVSFVDRVEVPSHVLVRFLDGESVLLNLETERYFGLDDVGTRMWQVVTAASSIDLAYQELLSEYDVEAELLRLNLSDLLGRLVDNGLLKVHSANVGPAAAI